MVNDSHAQEHTPTGEVAAASPMRISWVHVIPSLIGMGLSAYSLYLHHEIKTTGSSGCGFTETISCDKVLGSRFGEFLHIPLGVFGLVFFLTVVVMAVSTQPPSADGSVALSRLAVAGGGLLVSITLTVISFAAIHAACPVCLATHTCTLAVFGVSLWRYLKSA